jgi:ferritin-like protein
MITNTILALALMYGSYRLQKYLESKKVNIQHEAEMAEERNKQVFYFRERLYKEFDASVNDCMPKYQDMTSSKKPLIASIWVDVDKLVSLKNEVGIKSECCSGVNLSEDMYFTRPN